MKRSGLLIFLFSYSLLFIGPKINASQNQEDLRERISVTYLSQLGVTELTGHNDGIEVENYLASAELRKGDPWCAAFVNWCFEANGIDGPEKLAGYSPSWFPKGAGLRTQGAGKEPQRADVFGIYYTSKKRIAHVGFIDRWCGSYALTVEGNTNDDGSREGTAVCKKRRLTRQIYTTCDWIAYKAQGSVLRAQGKHIKRVSFRIAA